MTKICTIEGCGKSGHIKRGLCSTHYSRWLRHGDPSILTTARGLAPKFFSTVVLTYDNPTDCLIWPYSRNKAGYALYHCCGEVIAPRLICRVIYGAPPSRKHVAAHSCGNGHLGCVSRHHLRWATVKENTRDRFSTGTAAVSEKDIFEIRKLSKEGQTQRAIAAQFNIHHTSVHAIQHGKQWGWVDDSFDKTISEISNIMKESA